MCLPVTEAILMESMRKYSCLIIKEWKMTVMSMKHKDYDTQVGFKKLFFTKSCLFICSSSNSSSLKLTLSSKPLQNAGVQIQAFCALSCRLKVENKTGKMCTTAAYWASTAGIWYQGCRGALCVSPEMATAGSRCLWNQHKQPHAGLKEISKCLCQLHEAGHTALEIWLRAALGRRDCSHGWPMLRQQHPQGTAAVGNSCCNPKALWPVDPSLEHNMKKEKSGKNSKMKRSKNRHLWHMTLPPALLFSSPKSVGNTEPNLKWKEVKPRLGQD